ncbi:aquaporin family protein [Candidatus Saccharibacteria bacterium]|nr:aquaporin family protein [Candidatus Saccharibacteria bacterium]
MKKYIAEFIGTLVLVLIGCGTAMTVGCDPAAGSGYILTAFAFGLGLLTMAYSIGNISGCHINPAVSIAMLISKKISWKDFWGYIVFQILGALAGAGILALIFNGAGLVDSTGGFGANGLTGVNGNPWVGLLVEILLTFIFVISILGVTSDKAKHGHVAGIVIAFSLVAVHILGIGLTGTSVNPARSLGPAIVAAIGGNGGPIAAVWVFIVGPLLGGILAAYTYRLLEKNK